MKTGDEDTEIGFTAADFTAGFNDPDAGDVLEKIEVTSLPSGAQGVLKLNGAPVAPGAEIAVGQIGGLKFIPEPDFFGPVSFGWKGSDGETWSTASSMVTVTVTDVPEANQVPVVSSPLLSCLLYTSPSPRDLSTSRMPSSA